MYIYTYTYLSEPNKTRLRTESSLNLFIAKCHRRY